MKQPSRVAEYVSDERVRRLTLWGALVLWAAVVAALTLRGTGYDMPPEAGQLFCLACGPRALSDMILNWLLFMPLGLGLAWLVGFKWAVRVSVLATLGIEGGQIFLDGRYPGLQDILTNAAGGATGAWLATRITGRGVATAVLALSAVAWLSPFVLLTATTPDGVSRVRWAYRWPAMDRYSGKVLIARIGSVAIKEGEVEHGTILHDALAERAPIRAELVLGVPPTGLAPILGVFDLTDREILVVGAIGKDLLIRVASWSGTLRLDRPDVRWPDAFDRFEVGDTVAIELDRARSSYCLRVAQEGRCRLAPGPGDGWAFLLNLEGASGALRSALALLWSFGVGLAVGLTDLERRRSLLTVLALAVSGIVLATIHPDVRPAPTHAAALLVGGGAGAWLGPWTTRVVSFLRPDATDKSPTGPG